eukprot:969559_1
MVDISQDIEWEQNFEFDAKIQAKVNKEDDDDDNDNYESSEPHPSTSDDDQSNPNDTGNDSNNDPNKLPTKRARRPSNAELIDRVQQQQQEQENKNENDNNETKEDDKQKEIDEEKQRELELENSRRDFYSKEKHIFIVTWGGRPLYTRHGSLNDRHMTSFMGVVSLFPSNVERVNILTQDDIRSFITYDGVKFVYLLAGPLYFFCIT